MADFGARLVVTSKPNQRRGLYQCASQFTNALHARFAQWYEFDRERGPRAASDFACDKSTKFGIR